MRKDVLIKEHATLIEALKKLNKTAEKTLIVVDDSGRLLGTVTDGDIRRHIIKTGSLDGFVKDVYNKNPAVVQESEVLNREKIKKVFLEKKIELLPVVDADNKVVDFLVWTDVFSEKEESWREYKKINVPVVIMAGGKGKRLLPVTKVLPKPLIPVGEKTMIEHVMDTFKKFGVDTFYLTLNYKGELIEAYFRSIKENFNVKFLWEKDYLGTAGSLKFLEGKIEGDFIVSNCDVLLRVDFSKVLEFHRENKAVFTSITAIRYYKIPYGVVKITDGGLISGVIEKPEYTFQINTGVYVLNSRVLSYIPLNSRFDMPDLIKVLLEKKEKVLAYPVNENDYIDMGQWEEYKNALEKMLM